MKKEEFQVLGKGKPIYDAAAKVTGEKQYVADMKFPGMLYAKLLLSPIAHAKIIRIDTSKAEALKGVRAVIDYRNSSPVKYNSAKRFIDHSVICTEQIFQDRVRFVGDRVAAVAADTEQIAAEAIKLIEVEYEELPIIRTIQEAIREGAYPIQEGGNIVSEIEAGSRDVEQIFSECEYVLESTYETPGIHHAAIEPHAVIADWNHAGKLTVYAPTQNTFAFRVILSEIFGLSYNNVRVAAPAIGGAFGGKLEVTIEPVAAMLSKLCRKPVKLVLNRKETILQSRVRHGSLTKVKTGFDATGRIHAMDFCIYTNTGAYASSALNVAGALTHKVFAAYRVEHVHIRAIPVYTNTITAGAMRGYGSPQIYFGMQRQINDIAKRLGKDAYEIQLLNMVYPDSCNPLNHQPLGNPRPRDCLLRAGLLFEYEKAKEKEKRSKQENGRWVYGVGLALGVHGNNCYGAHRDNASPMIKMNEDGSCILYTGSHDMGTDTIGMQMQIVSEIMGISMDRMDVISADTASCLWHIGDYSSRGVFVTGKAVLLAAEKMAAELKNQASEMLETSPDNIRLSDNKAWMKSEPERSVSLKEIMIRYQSGKRGELCVYHTYEAKRGAFSYGVHMAEVCVDKVSGKVSVEKYAAVHDVGTVINPLSIEGQLHGAIQMGIGYALSEEISYDEKGNPRELVLKKYGVRRANQMPKKIITDFIEDKGGEPGGPYGAKALGECPVVPVAPAVVNAIANALDLPAGSLGTLPVKEEILKKEMEYYD